MAVKLVRELILFENSLIFFKYLTKELYLRLYIIAFVGLNNNIGEKNCKIRIHGDNNK